MCVSNDPLVELLHGKDVIAYNAGFDAGVMDRETARAFGDYQQALEWCRQIRWIDAMETYSAWVGDFSDYWGDFRWQRLGGGHRALGDCRAVLSILREMADSLTADAADTPQLQRALPTRDACEIG